MILISLALTWLVELVLYVRPIWRVRQAIVMLLAVVLPLVTVVYGSQLPLQALVVFMVLSVARIMLYAMIVQGRHKPARLYRTCRQASVYLISGQALLVGVGYWAAIYEIDWLYVLVSVQICAAIVLFMSTVRNLRHMRPPKLTHYLSDRELPTVTVAIPARNETIDVAECVQSILASDYPKLEILVLDDCSQDKTPDIIKSYAHDGVRFLRGREPHPDWLAKNYAYKQLYEAASGEVILFCGVDVRLRPHAIRTVINTMAMRNKNMVSVMPLRYADTLGGALIQPMRHWWEVALPRRVVNRPAVLSTCWAISRGKLKDLGGFDSVRTSVLPEAYFARELIKQDGYSFMRSQADLGVETVKSVREQRATALRVHYPQLHQRLELVVLLAIAEVLLLIGPYAVLLLAILSGTGEAQVFSGIAAFLLTMSHILIMRATNPTNTVVALVSFPFAVCVEIALAVTSMIRYEFGTVIWKGRDVCQPRLTVVDKLPPLPPRTTART